MTANFKYTVEQRRLLRNSRFLISWLWFTLLQFKSTIWAQSYPRKHTKCTTPLQERHFPTSLRHTDKTAVVLKLSKVIFVGFFTSTAKI